MSMGDEPKLGLDIPVCGGDVSTMQMALTLDARSGESRWIGRSMREEAAGQP